MGLEDIPSGERVHIAFFGARNAGKSSLANAVTGQDLAVVSEVKGTTTDPVRKAMELLPLGPVVVIDTPGLDDDDPRLGEERVGRARRILSETDIAVIAVDPKAGFGDLEKGLVSLLKERSIPYVTALTKADLHPAEAASLAASLGADSMAVSTKTLEGVRELKEKIASLARLRPAERRLVGDLLERGDLCVLVVPIDASAPKGRLILPQQQVLRDILDSHASAVVCQVEELEGTLARLSAPPRIVITDSQAFEKVAAIVPRGVPLTSFSILFARYKGDLAKLASGAKALLSLKDGDEVLISEGCSHHRQCGDIGTEKIPAWIRAKTGAELKFSFTSGRDFPDAAALSRFALVVHCGGCMLNAREMESRMEAASRANVPMVNYGMAIAALKGVLTRSLEPFEKSN